jgi:hypothetical protein
VAARADHQGAVDVAPQAGELRPCLSAQQGAAIAPIFEAEDQRVVGEAVAAAQGELARRGGALDVEAGEARALGKRPRAGAGDVGATEQAGAAAGGAKVPSLTARIASQVASLPAPISVESSSTYGRAALGTFIAADATRWAATAACVRSACPGPVD